MFDQIRTGYLSLVLVLSTVLVAGAAVGPAAAQTTVAVDSPTAVSPGETVTITITGAEASEIRLSGDLEGWTVNSTDPANTFTVPNPANTPYTGQAGDVWGQIYNSQGEKSWELTMTAPEETGEHTFTANVTNDAGETATETVTVTVADPAVDAPSERHVTPGSETEITVNGTDVKRLGLRDVPDGWTLVSQEKTDENGTTFISKPADSENTSDDWVVAFDDVQANASYTATVVAPETEDRHEFSAVGAHGVTDVENFTVSVSSIAEYDDRVAPGEETEITVGGEATGEVTLTGELRNWTLTEANPDGLMTSPSADQLPYTGRENETWGAIFLEEGDNTWTVSVTPPNETGNYTLTATAIDDAGEARTQSFVVTVAEPPAEHESGVGQETFDAVDADDDETLSVGDLRTSIINYVQTGGTIDGVDVSTTELRELVAYYIGQ